MKLNKKVIDSITVCGLCAMTAFPRWGKVERELPRRKTSLAACGRRHTRRHNDTPALNTLKVLRGAPISMGRGETPVELCQQPSVSLLFFFESLWIDRKLFN